MIINVDNNHYFYSYFYYFCNNNIIILIIIIVINLIIIYVQTLSETNVAHSPCPLGEAVKKEKFKWDEVDVGDGGDGGRNDNEVKGDEAGDTEGKMMMMVKKMMLKVNNHNNSNNGNNNNMNMNITINTLLSLFTSLLSWLKLS